MSELLAICLAENGNCYLYLKYMNDWVMFSILAGHTWDNEHNEEYLFRETSHKYKYESD